jgi:hypothetical protein
MKTPYKQGLLDGMCGFYSVINAIHYLKSDFTIEKAEKLLKSMISLKPHSFHRMYSDGTYHENVISFVKHIISKRGFKTFSYSTPFQDDEFEDAHEFVSCLKQHVDGKKSVAIVLVGNPWYHWTVISKIDTKKELIHLFDSCLDPEDEECRIKMMDLSLKKKQQKYELCSQETIIISRK